MNIEDLMTVNQAADYLGIHQQSVRDAIKAGALTPVKIGVIFLRRCDVKAYKHRTQPEGKPRRGGRPPGSRNRPKDGAE